MDGQERREAVRRIYDYRCGYCGVREEEAWTQLEIDHFQPRSAGGGDMLDNLVYCCPTCNRLKGDFAPTDDPSTTHRRLLHPKRDDSTAHLREEADGRVTALTETGVFHIERLRLNRPPLVVLRRTRQAGARLYRDLAVAREEQMRLRERLASLYSPSHSVALIARWPRLPAVRVRAGHKPDHVSASVQEIELMSRRILGR